MNESRLVRVNKLIGYLIFIGELPLKAMQQQIAKRIDHNKSSTTKALNGYEDYLTDNFIEKFNDAYGSPFNIDWLLKGSGEMIKNIQENSNFQQGENISYKHEIYPRTIFENSKNYQEIIMNSQKQIDEFQKIFTNQQEQINKLIGIIEQLNRK
jgi:hypothetical protein